MKKPTAKKMPDHPKFKVGSDGSVMLNFGAYGEEVEVASVSGNGRRVLTVRQVGKADIWDAEAGSLVGSICPYSPLVGTPGQAPNGGTFKLFVESAALDMDGSYALLGLNDGTAGIFRVADGSPVAMLNPPGEQPAAKWGVIRAVAYSPDFSLALVGFDGRRVGVWTADGSRLIAFLAAPSGNKVVGKPFVRETLVTSLASSADRKWLFMGCTDMSAAIWQLDTKRILLEAVEHAEETLALFDDGLQFGLFGGFREPAVDLWRRRPRSLWTSAWTA